MVIRWAIAVVVVAFFGGYAAIIRSSARPIAGPLPTFQELGKSLAGWSGVDIVTVDGNDNLLGADSYVRRLYRREDGTEVLLYIAYFQRQKVNSQIHSPRNCLPGGGWRVDRIEKVSEMAGERRSRQIRMVIRRRDQSQEVRYWFHTQMGIAADEYALKWSLVKTALRGRPTNAAFVRFSAGLADSSKMHELMQLLEPQIASALHPSGI